MSNETILNSTKLEIGSLAQATKAGAVEGQSQIKIQTNSTELRITET